eukprot:363602-Pelagomonas_calceolata.AAC.2
MGKGAVLIVTATPGLSRMCYNRRQCSSFIRGTEKQIENSLHAARQVASRRNVGNKVQNARDTCGAKNKLVHQYSKKERVLHFEFDCKNTHGWGGSSA